MTEDIATTTAESPEIVICGETSKGKVFRPSDWAERLAGLVSQVGPDNRLNYCPRVQPVTRSGIRCVVVSRSLEQEDNKVFVFLMDFARENDLKIVEGRKKLREEPSPQ